MCRAWMAFLQAVNPAVLGQILSQVVVALQPLLETYPKQVAEIYHFLIVDNRATLKDHFGEVCFCKYIVSL